MCLALPLKFSRKEHNGLVQGYYTIFEFHEPASHCLKGKINTNSMSQKKMMVTGDDHYLQIQKKILLHIFAFCKARHEQRFPAADDGWRLGARPSLLLLGPRCL